MKLRFWSGRKFLGLIDFCHFFTKEYFDNKHELLLVRIDMEEKWKNFYQTTLCQILRNLPLLAWTQGQILEAHVGFATRSAVFGPLWKSLWLQYFSRGQYRVGQSVAYSSRLTLSRNSKVCFKAALFKALTWS